MIIEWLGHSCFKIVSDIGVVVVFDPFDPNYTGLDCKKINADVISISHGHGDHSALHQVEGYSLVVSKHGTYEYKNIKIQTIKSFHDNKKGALRGENLISILYVDSLKICHFGDMGENLTKDQIEKIGKVDIILIPIGGIYTIDAKQAKEFLNILKPQITIPMHYNIKDLKFELGYLSTFLEMFDAKDIKIMKENSIKISKEDLKNHPKILVLGFDRAIENS